MKVLTKEEVAELVKVGTPVQVLLSRTADTTNYLGEGVMLKGHYAPKLEHPIGLPNPCIYLPEHDRIVWGFQIWFSEKMELEGDIVKVPIPEQIEEYEVTQLEESDIAEHDKRLEKLRNFSQTLTDVVDDMIKGEDTTEKQAATAQLLKKLIGELT